VDTVVDYCGLIENARHSILELKKKSQQERQKELAQIYLQGGTISPSMLYFSEFICTKVGASPYQLSIGWRGTSTS
jgi:hypothetical protein